jgi:hypothetical protein
LYIHVAEMPRALWSTRLDNGQINQIHDIGDAQSMAVGESLEKLMGSGSKPGRSRSLAEQGDARVVFQQKRIGTMPTN